MILLILFSSLFNSSNTITKKILQHRYLFMILTHLRLISNWLCSVQKGNWYITNLCPSLNNFRMKHFRKLVFVLHTVFSLPLLKWLRLKNSIHINIPLHVVIVDILPNIDRWSPEYILNRYFNVCNSFWHDISGNQTESETNKLRLGAC